MPLIFWYNTIFIITVKNTKQVKNNRLNKLNADEVKIKRETSRIWMGVGLAIFGCVLIMTGLILPPAGLIHPSVLTAVGEVFGLSGASMGIFAYNKRDNAKIDYLYNAEKQRNTDETQTGEDI